MKIKWIPIEERLPETDDYILLSYSNFNMIDIGRYEVNEDGDGAFYPEDSERSCSQYGFFVDAWMPIIPPYKGDVRF